jgi:hypothetical protein
MQLKSQAFVGHRKTEEQGAAKQVCNYLVM